MGVLLSALRDFGFHSSVKTALSKDFSCLKAVFSLEKKRKEKKRRRKGKRCGEVLGVMEMPTSLSN